MVNETLRLYPPAFVIVRQAIAADRAGIDIPRGAVVMIAPWVLHRHRRLWRDPDAFDPSRFLPDAPPPPRFTYLPFGAGPRVCVGAQFALAEATLVLAPLMRTFRVTLNDRVDAGGDRDDAAGSSAGVSSERSVDPTAPSSTSPAKRGRAGRG